MNQKSLESSKLFKHIKRRALYYIGSICIYILPIIYILPKLNIITTIEPEKHTSISVTWCIVGVLYLMFVAKFLRNKIHDMQPKPIKTFLSGITSLIPVTVLGAFISLIEQVINKLPEINISQYIWNTVLLIALGLVLQIIDSVINRKYLYDLEIAKEAKRAIDIENKKQQLIKAREEMEG